MKRLSIVVALIALAFAQDAFAVGQLTGRIAGTITAKEGGATMPGIDITVSGPALIGGPRTLVSNDDGSYEVVELPPGVYTVEVGFRVAPDSNFIPGAGDWASRTGAPSVRSDSLLPMSTASEVSIGTHCSLRAVFDWMARLVTSTHSPSVVPVWISVRIARPLTYRHMKVLPPA